MSFFNTFRGRLLLILAFLLVATLGVQFFANIRTQDQNDKSREMQEQALVAGIALGVSGITSKDQYLQELIAAPEQTFFDERIRGRIKDIIIIDESWNITDSLNPEYVPVTSDDGSVVYKKLSELEGLPPLLESTRLGEDLKNFPNGGSSDLKNSADEAHAVPIETSQGRWYVMVLLRNDKSEVARRAAQPLVFTLAILLMSTLITFYLVWRFTRPIANLSQAAREVAEGNLGVRVSDYQRNDEMGHLARRFNEMTSELEKKADLEAQLRQAEKSAVVGRLGSAIAHEIRNPLNYINLTLDHLGAKFKPEGEKKATFEKLVSQLKAEVARINQQISDFLNYSRPANINLRLADVRQIIEDSLRIVEAQAAENDIKISLVEHEDVPQINADPEFLRSVFNNLFINAVQAMGNAPGTLNVRVMRDDDPAFVRIEVADTGPGIPPENLSKIFEPYFSTKETGTGLGLAIVQKIIEMHNGTIDAESRVGDGTRFTVRLTAAGK